MPSGLVSQIQRVVGRLNSGTRPLPGQSVASGTGEAQYRGLIGQRVSLGYEDALALSDTAIATLQSGVYQLVRLLSTSTGDANRGRIAFWSDYDDYVVTVDEPTGVSQIAGIFLGGTVVKGDYLFIQTEGVAAVQFRATLTKAGAVGDYVIAAGAGAGADVAEADTIADATALTPVLGRRFLGIAVAAPANNTISTVHLGLGRWNF